MKKNSNGRVCLPEVILLSLLALSAGFNLMGTSKELLKGSESETTVSDAEVRLSLKIDETIAKIRAGEDKASFSENASLTPEAGARHFGWEPPVLKKAVRNQAPTTSADRGAEKAPWLRIVGRICSDENAKIYIKNTRTGAVFPVQPGGGCLKTETGSDAGGILVEQQEDHLIIEYKGAHYEISR